MMVVVMVSVMHFAFILPLTWGGRWDTTASTHSPRFKRSSVCMRVDTLNVTSARTSRPAYEVVSSTAGLGRWSAASVMVVVDLSSGTDTVRPLETSCG